MKNKKALFFDIDGTLYSSKLHKIPQSTLDILKELSLNNNIDMYISTGRSSFTLNEIKDVLPYFKGLNLANGGHIIVNGEDKFIDTINPSIVLSFVKKCDELKASYAVITKNKNLVKYYNEEIKGAMEKAIDCEYELVIDHSWYNDVIEFWLLEKNNIIDKLRQEFINLKFFYWSKFGADVVPAYRSKATGIKKIIAMNDYDYQNTFAFGDADNDVPMFRAVNVSFAMGKCSKECELNATYKTALIEDDGIEKAIRKYIL